jgi:hypothetical protein
MAVAYIVGGRKKEAIYSHLYDAQDVDETLKTPEWKSFIKTILSGVTTDIGTGQGIISTGQAGIASPDIPSPDTPDDSYDPAAIPLTVAQLTKASLLAMRLQLIGSISLQIAATSFDPDLRIKYMETANSLMDKQPPPQSNEGGNNVVINMMPRRDAASVFDTNAVSVVSRVVDAQPITIEARKRKQKTESAA